MTSGVQLSGVGGPEVLPYLFLKIEKKCTDLGKKPWLCPLWVNFLI